MKIVSIWSWPQLGRDASCILEVHMLARRIAITLALLSLQALAQAQAAGGTEFVDPCHRPLL
jgi:hypothetical protein